MNDFNPSQVWAVACVLLFFKMVLIAMVQGQQRMKHKTFTKPEDAAAFGKTAVADKERPIVERGQRALRNDLENIPIFLFLGLAYIQTGSWPAGFLMYAAIFVASRYAHTAFYLRPTQPLRTIAYGLGLISMMAMSVHILVKVFVG